MGKIALVVLPAALLVLLFISLNDIKLTQKLFVNTTYYLLMATVLCWAGTYLHAARDLRWASVVAWVKDNWPGLVVAFGVTLSAGLAVEPALRVLSDEANLVGISKNLFASQSATFTVSGKYYYGSYWDIDVAVDRRPTLFPFLVSLIHSVVGYSIKNAFALNLVVLAAFVLVSYRLAKSLAGTMRGESTVRGETFGIVAALFVVAHPILLITARSGAFDFFAAFFSLLIIKSLLDFVRDQSPAKLAIVWMNLCMFAEVRYESALFIPPVVALLLLFRMPTFGMLRSYAFVYALTPAYLLPRIWQSMLRGNVPEQDPGTVTFSVENFVNNAHEYVKPILEPAHSYPAHSAVLIALGALGSLFWLRWLVNRVRAGAWQDGDLRFGIFVLAWMVVQVVIVFTYFWGRSQYPSAARLVIVIDTFFSFAAAWILTRSLDRWRPFVSVLFAVAFVAIQLPVAAQHRMMNKLTQTRESAATWAFFESVPDKRILIVTDRPNHFTIMGFGAMSFESARRDPYLFTALERRLFQEVYVIQQIQLSTNEPLAGYETWPDRKLETVHEFQNDANVLVRISRVTR